jgi:hypothetical protein
MVGYMRLEEQVDADFSRARRRALLRKVRFRLRRNNAWEGLLCFDDLRKIPGAVGRVYRGMRTVAVAQIGGSVGRCAEFDGDFMPTRASAQERWKRIDLAFHRGEVLPPVSLYKVGGLYFVLDGHHHVSVAAYHGVKWIDAEVTEYRPAGLQSNRRDKEGLKEASQRGESSMQEMMDIHRGPGLDLPVHGRRAGKVQVRRAVCERRAPAGADDLRRVRSCLA